MPILSPPVLADGLKNSKRPNRIREIRKQRGLTQADVGRLVGCSHAQISELERGVVALTHDWMVKIACAMKCAVTDLLPDEENPHRLSDEERAFIEMYRLADLHQREQLARLAGVVIPFKPEPPRRK